jgi:hypothetical protein
LELRRQPFDGVALFVDQLVVPQWPCFIAKGHVVDRHHG